MATTVAFILSEAEWNLIVSGILFSVSVLFEFKSILILFWAYLVISPSIVRPSKHRFKHCF